MKKIIFLLTLLGSTTVFADSYAYFNVAKESEPKAFNCEVNLETGEKISGTVMVAGNGGATEAFEKFVGKKSTRSKSVYLLKKINPKDASLSFFELTRDSKGQDLSEVKILNNSFCALEY